MTPILEIVLPVPLNQSFDYLAPEHVPISALKKGLRVLVPFGQREKVGFIVGIRQSSCLPVTQLKQVITLLDEEVLLPDPLIRLLDWTHRYYHHPLGEVFAHAFPTLLRKVPKKKQAIRLLEKSACPTSPPSNWTTPFQTKHTLNTAQRTAVDTITQSLGTFNRFLLHGITGSGKTEVYLDVIAAVLQRQEQALVLLPEIGLTPQMLQRFAERFSAPLLLFHSKLTEKQRLTHWLCAQRGEAAIILGTRSALFTPLSRPGVIIIDEEHDASFKQQQGLRYHARDVALVRAKLENIPIILGSATASLESLANVEHQRYHFLSLPKRAGTAHPPVIKRIDLRQQKVEAGFSPLLLERMKNHLQLNGQVLLFLNRRGFAPLTRCLTCGWSAQCPRCEQALIAHKKPLHWQCHYCGFRTPPLQNCPDCVTSPLTLLGQGTQRLETTLQKYFPDIDVVRLDKDSTQRKGCLEELLSKIQQGEKQILIGTQMLAKGHHFPNVTLVGILETDTGLFSADFRALERTGQLITQVAGRAGRADKLGEVLIQTYHPEHPLLTQLITEGYLAFSRLLLEERRAAQLPPYAHLALIQAEALKAEEPLGFLNTLKTLAQTLGNAVTLWGPVPCLQPRRAGYYRAQLLLQATHRAALHHVLAPLSKQIPKLSQTRRVRWSIDVDPLEVI